MESNEFTAELRKHDIKFYPQPWESPGKRADGFGPADPIRTESGRCPIIALWNTVAQLNLLNREWINVYPNLHLSTTDAWQIELAADGRDYELASYCAALHMIKLDKPTYQRIYEEVRSLADDTAI